MKNSYSTWCAVAWLVAGCGGGGAGAESDARTRDGGRVDAAALDGSSVRDGAVDAGRDATMVAVDAAGFDDAASELDGAFDGATDDGGIVGGADAGDASRGDAAMSDGGRVDGGRVDASMLDACAALSLARLATPGTFTNPITIAGAFVSYVMPELPNVPQGVFVQCDADGPAIFVSFGTSNPSPSPAPEAGDVVTFRIGATQRYSSGSGDEVLMATRVSDWTRSPTSVVVGAQDITAIDVRPMLDEYESELVSFRGTVANAPSAAGTGYSAVQVTTTGISTAAATFRFRFPTSLGTTWGLTTGCVVDVMGVPMWRLARNAQPTAHLSTEASVTCPAFSVVSAQATSATRVVVTFSQSVRVASVASSDFMLSGGLSVTGTATSGNQVTLTTSMQTPGTSYDVMVSGVDAISGSALGTMTMATFTGYQGGTCAATSHVVINEVDYDTVGTDENTEFIELYNPTSAPVDLSNWLLILINGANTTATEYDRLVLTGTLDSHQYLVITAPSGDAGVGLSVPTSARRLTFGGTSNNNRIQNGSRDGIALLDASGAVVDAAMYEGTIASFVANSPTRTITVSESTSIGTDSNTEYVSLQRIPNGCDTNVPADDWELATPTVGVEN